MNNADFDQNRQTQWKKNKRPPNGASDASEKHSFTTAIKYSPISGRISEKHVEKRKVSVAPPVKPKLFSPRNLPEFCDLANSELTQHPPRPPPILHASRTACSLLFLRSCAFLPFSFLSHSSDILAPSSEEGCREPPRPLLERRKQLCDPPHHQNISLSNNGVLLSVCHISERMPAHAQKLKHAQLSLENCVPHGSQANVAYPDVRTYTRDCCLIYIPTPNEQGTRVQNVITHTRVFARCKNIFSEQQQQQQQQGPFPDIHTLLFNAELIVKALRTSPERQTHKIVPTFEDERVQL